MLFGPMTRISNTLLILLGFDHYKLQLIKVAVDRSPVSVLRRGTQTQSGSVSSSVSDPSEVSRAPSHVRNSATQCPLHCVDASMQTSASTAKPGSTTTKKVSVLSKIPSRGGVMYQSTSAARAYCAS